MPIPALGRKFCLNSINRFISSLTENDYCSAWDLVQVLIYTSVLCPVQTPHFTGAESNANEGEQGIVSDLHSIRLI